MTDEWKALVVATMAARKPPMSRADLARELNVTRGLITKMMRPIADGGQQVSALVPRVCELLGVPMPHQAAPEVEERRRRLNNVLNRLNDDQLEGALRFLESMIR